MGGGLMQLVAYGAQDIYLTGQPQITFFKSVYRRHTNFSVESIQQTINGSVSAGQRVTVTISRNGDLLKNLWIQYNPSKLVTNGTKFAADVSHAMLQTLEIDVGGQLIDRQYGLWLTIWRDLTEVNPTGAQGLLGAGAAEPDNLTTAVPSTRYQRMAFTHRGGDVANSDSAPTQAFIPMRFWFCRNPGLAIPLIALQYHEVKFNIQFALQSAYSYGGTSNLSGCDLAVYADYVYLDTTERRQFAQNAHEYLIEQLQQQQESGSSSTSNTMRLNFNHPVKELIFCGTPAFDASGSYEMGAATPGPITAQSGARSEAQIKIILNGTDRFTARNLKYFTRNQIWDCHTGFGATAVEDSIAVFSFALRPEEHQPSGTCNFSRIDTAQLQIVGEVTKALTIYAVNYNVFRVMSGMGGLKEMIFITFMLMLIFDQGLKAAVVTKRALVTENTLRLAPPSQLLVGF
jgi:hypothetical protein